MSAKLFLRDLTGFASANLARSVIPFLLMPILTAKLGAAGYGVLSLLEVTILIFTPLFLLNSTALISTRYYKLDERERRAAIATSLLSAGAIALVAQIILLAFGTSAQSILNLSDQFYLLLPIFILVRTITTYISGVYQIQQRPELYGVYSVGILVLDLFLSLTLVVGFDWGYKGRLLGSHIAMFVGSTIGLWHLWRMNLLEMRVNRAYLIDILRFGTPLIPHTLGGVALAMSSRYLIEYYRGVADVGIYAAAYQLGSAMLLVGTSINQVWSITLFKLLSTGIESNRNAIRKLLLMNIVLVLAFTIALYFLRDILFAIFLHPEFRTATNLFPWLLAGFSFQSLYFLFVNFDFYEESTMRIGAFTVGAALLNILLNVLLLPRYGIIGASWAAAASMGVYFFLVTVRVMLFSKSFRTVWSHG